MCPLEVGMVSWVWMAAPKIAGLHTLLALMLLELERDATPIGMAISIEDNTIPAPDNNPPIVKGAAKQALGVEHVLPPPFLKDMIEQSL